MVANVVAPHTDLSASSRLTPFRGRRRRGLSYFIASASSRNCDTLSSRHPDIVTEELQGRHPFLRSSTAPQPSVTQETSGLQELTQLDGSAHSTFRSMARHRATTAPQENRASSQGSNANNPAMTSPPAGHAALPMDQMPTIRFASHTDARSTRPSLSFPPTSRTLPREDCVIRVGRYSERDGDGNPPPNLPSAAPVGFKSKVVSRRHCEFWCNGGQWYIKDVKSSSGTFLNHIRLSQPNEESRPFPVKDGDVVQLGIDFRGGEEPIFRCVKIRVECNRAWQKSLNSFNLSTHKRLRDLGKTGVKDADGASTHSSECAICLMSIAPCQSLFVAPCSHVWHYKCIRPILNDLKTYPSFLCPNCRAVADLAADVDEPIESEWDNSIPQSQDQHDQQQMVDNMQASHMTNGVSGHHDDTEHREQDNENDIIEAMASTNLAFRNNDSPIEPSGPSTLQQRRLMSQTPHHAAQQTKARGDENPGLSPDLTIFSSPSPSTSILNRRNAQRHSPSLTPEPENNVSRSIEQQTISSYGNYLRPITPTAPLTVDNDITSAGAATTDYPNGRFVRPGQGGSDNIGRVSTPRTTEKFVVDGPITPTNSAGPFVFDGSAGRSASAEGEEG